MLHKSKMHVKFTDKKKSLLPSLIDVLKAFLSGKSPEAFWNRQMTATRTTCHSSFLTTKRELGIRNVKVQGETKLVTVYWFFFLKGRVHTKLELRWKELQNSPGFPITGNNLNLSNSSDSPVPQEAFLLTSPITIYPYYRNKALGQEAQVYRQLVVLHRALKSGMLACTGNHTYLEKQKQKGPPCLHDIINAEA